MSMISVITRIIVLMIIFSGVTLIYDARTLTKKFFSFGDQNEGVSGIKMVGFILALIGGIIMYVTLL